MRFVGKYSLTKKDKNNNVIQKITKKNIITKNGQKQILKLIASNSDTNYFNDMVGYDVLDLSQKIIQPCFSNGSKVISKFKFKSDNVTIDNGYQSYFLNEEDDDSYLKMNDDNFSNKKISWKIKTSFFIKKRWEKDTQTLFVKTVMPFDQTKTLSTDFWSHYILRADKQINGQASISRKLNYKTCDPPQSQWKFSSDDVDNILLKNNQKYCNWTGLTPTEYWENDCFYPSCHLNSIDFFRVLCIQKIQTNNPNQITEGISLWQGYSIEENSQIKNQQIIYKTDLNQGQYNKNNLCLRVKYKKVNSNQDFTYLRNGTNDGINIYDGKIFFNNSEFNDNQSWNNRYQIIVQYYVYYKDERIKNGICGMFLDYSFINKNNEADLFKRSFLGKGSFSSNGGKQWDQCCCFPWNGKPTKISYLKFNHSNPYEYTNLYNFNFNNNDNYLKNCFLVNSQQNDNINQHFYSFYPYVYKNATNFQFMTYLRNQKIRIKKFLFLTPKYKPKAPNTFVFGNGTNQVSKNDLTLGNQKLRKNVQKTNIEYGSSNLTISWSTILQFDQANDFDINQVGICFDEQFVKCAKGDWYYLKPNDINDDKILFSRIVLPNSINKDEQSTIQVNYEIEIQ